MDFSASSPISRTCAKFCQGAAETPALLASIAIEVSARHNPRPAQTTTPTTGANSWAVENNQTAVIAIAYGELPVRSTVARVDFASTKTMGMSTVVIRTQSATNILTDFAHEKYGAIEEGSQEGAAASIRNRSAKCNGSENSLQQRRGKRAGCPRQANLVNRVGKFLDGFRATSVD